MKCTRSMCGLRPLVALALTLLFSLGLVACHTGDTLTETDPPTEEPTAVDTDPATEPSETETDPAAPDTLPAETESETESGTEAESETMRTEDALRTDENRQMDMIVWYDIDHGYGNNDRPDNGWYYLYPETPYVTYSYGLYRSATPLLGTYNQSDIATARQHIYWLMAAGCNGITCDWTNYQSRFDETADASAIKYRNGVYRNTEVLLQAVAELQAAGVAEVPKVYLTIRLEGTDYDRLEPVLNEVYTLYEAYADQIYHFDGSDKPFLVIFAEKTNIRQADTKVQDDRFDIRWSNGHLESLSRTDENGNGYMEARRNLWLFIENVKSDTEGYYKTFYTVDEDGNPEMMTAWTAVWLGWNSDGTRWDGQNTYYDGLSAFERTTVDVETLNPKALLVCRFNYPMSWYEQPQEGLGLYQSVHFEPCEELGFSLFNHVTQRLYDLNDWIGEVPPAPVVTEAVDNHLFISYDGYPLEYRIAVGETELTYTGWSWINVNTGLDYTAFADAGTLYVQTRNAFGESEVAVIEVENTAKTFTVEEGLILREDFDGTTDAELKASFEVDESFGLADGWLTAQWVEGRGIRYNATDLRYYAFETKLIAGEAGGDGALCYKAAIALRVPAELHLGGNSGGAACYEPDNGDSDRTSYLGKSGIYVYCFGSTVEVAVHVKDDGKQLGAGSLAYSFPLPAGKSFAEGVVVRCEDRGDEVRILCEGELIATIRLSDVGTVDGQCWQGDGYRKAEIIDADGTTVLTTEGYTCLIPTEGDCAVVERANSFKLDYIELWQYGYTYDGRTYILN